MKSSDRRRWEELRHQFVLTSEEKRVIAFIIVALLLGVATKCYRDTHPQPIEKRSPAIRKVDR